MILHAEGLTFSYSGSPVIDGAGFTLEEGTLTALLGMNGAGKSTLLKCINGILQPSAGKIQIDGRELSELSRIEVARSMGYVPQNSGYNSLTVMDTILMGRRPYSPWAPTRKDEEVADRVIDLLNLGPFANRNMENLSGGEAQKVLIGRALAQDPLLLLLDEPTSSLDLKNQREVMGIMRHLVEQHNMTILASIHDINMALKYADAIMMLGDGKILWAGPPEEVTAESVSTVYDLPVRLVNHDGMKMIVTD